MIPALFFLSLIAAAIALILWCHKTDREHAEYVAETERMINHWSRK